MLVLKRTAGGEFIISHGGEELRIKVVEILKHTVRIGFEGSKSFDIVRPDAEKRETESNFEKTEK